MKTAGIRMAALLLGLGTAFPAMSEESFLPREQGARERDILEEIREELGEPLKPAAHAPKPTAQPPAQSPAGPVWKRASVELADGRRWEGRLRVARAPIVLETGDGLHQTIALDVVRELRFADHRLLLTVSVDRTVRSYFFPTRCDVITARETLRGRCRPGGFLSLPFEREGNVRRLSAYFRLTGSPASSEVRAPADTLVTIRLLTGAGRAPETAARNIPPPVREGPADVRKTPTAGGSQHPPQESAR